MITPTNLLLASILMLSMTASSLASELSLLSGRHQGKSYSIASKALQSDRVIDVYLPESHQYSTNRYPVIYVMDSDFLFDTTVSIARNRWSRDLAPESIVVGIRSRNNQERFNFAMPMKRGDGSVSFENSQPEKMAQFFSEELSPLIEDTFRANDYRVVIGMSPTATNVLHDYLSDTPFFDAHMAIAADLQFKTLADKPLHFAITEKAKSTKNGFIVVSRASTDLKNDPSREDFFRYLMDFPKAETLGIYSVLPEATEHYSVALKTIDYGFEKLFPMALWRPDYRSLRNSEDPVPVLKAFYEKLDNTVGFDTYPTVDGYWMGNSILGLARFLGRNQKFPQALEMLKWADSKQPNNIWINHYLSRVSSRLDDQQAALEFAKTAVRLAKERKDEDIDVFKSNLADIEVALKIPPK